MDRIDLKALIDMVLLYEQPGNEDGHYEWVAYAIALLARWTQFTAIIADPTLNIARHLSANKSEIDLIVLQIQYLMSIATDVAVDRFVWMNQLQMVMERIHRFVRGVQSELDGQLAREIAKRERETQAFHQGPHQGYQGYQGPHQGYQGYQGPHQGQYAHSMQSALY